MRPYSADHLRDLAEAYSAATGTSLSALGNMVAANQKLFKRLALGFTCTLENAEKASEWFDSNWPEGVPWPNSVPSASSEAAE